MRKPKPTQKQKPRPRPPKRPVRHRVTGPTTAPVCRLLSSDGKPCEQASRYYVGGVRRFVCAAHNPTGKGIRLAVLPVIDTAQIAA
jgi:hypothetical protein